MYIGVCGVHSSGKTTFLRELKTKLAEVGFVSETIDGLPTEAAEKGFPILRQLTFETTLWIISTCIARELEASINCDVVLVDRAVPDALGYYLAALKSNHRKVDPVEWEYLKEIARHHSKRYDLLFKTIMDESIPIGSGKIRDTDPIYRKLVDNFSNDIFDEYIGKWRSLGMGNREKSIGLCVAMVRDRFERNSKGSGVEPDGELLTPIMQKLKGLEEE